MPYALCPMPYALCPMPYALCPMHLNGIALLLRKAIYVTVNNCSALKKQDYLLTLLDFSWYILDNGSGGKNFIFATTPIIKLYLIKC